MTNLHRTFNPKYTHYLGDGSGRDSYIIKNNGGLCIEPARPAKQESTMFFTRRVSTSTPAPLYTCMMLTFLGRKLQHLSTFLMEAGEILTY